MKKKPNGEPGTETVSGPGSAPEIKEEGPEPAEDKDGMAETKPSDIPDVTLSGEP